MICTIEGKQFEFPESELIETQVTGIALVESGVVTEEDIANADKDAASDFQMLPVNTGAKLMHLQHERSAGKTIPSLLKRPEKALVRSSRMYFELSDRTVSLSPPLGRTASHIECYWMFSWVPKTVLQGIGPSFEKGKPAAKPKRVCFIEGKQCRIPAELIDKPQHSWWELPGTGFQKMTSLVLMHTLTRSLINTLPDSHPPVSRYSA